MTKVSILVPVYNVAQYLPQCIESIINQSLYDIEIICINDGSSDNSLSFLEDYAALDERIKIINKENSGYGDSMNTGLAQAKGEYIGIVESDDFISNDMFENLYAIAKHYDCDIVKSNYYSYYSKDNLPKLTNLTYRHAQNCIINCKEDLSLLDIQPSIWSAIYKKNFLVKNNINFLQTPGASFQDTSFAFKAMSLAKKIFLTEKAYLYYRQDNINSSVNSKEKIYAIVEEFEEIERFLNQNPHLKKIFNTQKLICQFKRFEWNIERIDKKYRLEFINRFSDLFKEYYKNNELDTNFYKKISHKKLKILINHPQKYKKYIEREIFINKLRQARKKFISIKLSRNYCRINFLGKKILEVV